MSACAKFKIATVFLLSPSRFQRFSTGSSKDSNSKKGSSRRLSLSDPKADYNPYKLSKDKVTNSFVSNASGTDMEILFSKWIKDPKSVHKSWQRYFTEVLSAGDEKISRKTTNGCVTTAETPKTAEKEIFSKEVKLCKETDEDVSLSGSNPTQPPQESDYIVGHIIFAPVNENIPEDDYFKSGTKSALDVKSSTADATKQQSMLKKQGKKRPSKGNKTKIQTSKSSQKHEQGLERVKDAVRKTPFRNKGEYFKSQLERIAKLKIYKSQEPKKSGSQPTKPNSK